MPSSSFYICDDGCIRIVCPKNGNVVTVMMSPQWRRIKDAVYAIKEGMFLLLLLLLLIQLLILFALCFCFAAI